jgi:hypothetical protein
MKTLCTVVACLLLLCSFGFAQAAQPTAFSTTTFSFNLSPINLPGLGSSVSGAETDAMFPLTANNRFGETTLIGESTFVGGRFDHVFPSVAKYLQEHTALTGGNFEAGVTSSLGVVKSGKTNWGGRAGLFLRYAPGGATNFNIGFEAQANYLPSYAGLNSPHWVPSIAVGPNFRF